MESSDTELTILIFTWNHQGLRISGPKGLESFLSYELHEPDFFVPIHHFIQSQKPDLVVFGSQEDPMPGSYFHSHYLPETLASQNYLLLKKTKLMGVGIETYKALKGLDLKLRGLRLSIYVKDNLFGSIKLEERNLVIKQSYANCSYPILQSKGAVALYVRIPQIGSIGFVCCHLPFDAGNLKRAYLEKSYRIRDESLDYSNSCLNYILNQLVFQQELEHIFFFGDLNYRVFVPEADETLFEKDYLHHLNYVYRKYDELYQCLKSQKIKLSFKEGVEGKGPMFIPTCKMRKPRDLERQTIIKEEDKEDNIKEDNIKENNIKENKLQNEERFDVDVEECNVDEEEEFSLLFLDHTLKFRDSNNIRDYFNIGIGQRQPSWCDRILYYTLLNSKNNNNCDNNNSCNDNNNKIEDVINYKIECEIYDRFDFGRTMEKSDHCAVIGKYKISHRK
jgi:hypothetical protein